jgi:hypothetical protein
VRRHNIDLLGTEGKAAAFRLMVLPRVVVRRFTGSTIGISGRSGQRPPDTGNVQVCRCA